MCGAAVWVLRKVNGSRWIEEEDQNSKDNETVVFTIFSFSGIPRPELNTAWDPDMGTGVNPQSSRRLPLDLAPEQKKGTPKAQSGCRGLPPSISLLSIFLHSAISWQLQFNKSQNVRDRSLPLQLVELWSPESGENPVACLLPFSNPPLFDPPCGPQSGTIKATELWSEDQRGDPWEPEIIGKLQRGTSSEKWTYKVICELLGSPLSCACMGLILTGIPKSLRTEWLTDHYPRYRPTLGDAHVGEWAGGSFSWCGSVTISWLWWWEQDSMQVLKFITMYTKQNKKQKYIVW